MNERTRPSGDRAARKRAAIIGAARAQFLEHGFGAGVDQIAAQAGVSKMTVYNHFGSKEDLFADVIGDALEQALGTTAEEMSRQLEADDDIREVLIATARGWVQGIAQDDVLRLRTLIAAETRRFPSLGRAWREQGPERFAEPLGTALHATPDLEIPDLEVAIIQFYALVLYPHVVHSTYGDRLSPDLTERLIERGVDMFLAYYRAS
ncbi:TetR/AcrR family transcriptional regulator [Kitasatospora sp. NPDC001547]|uniref:TetR/AcrR family transcriptional regulator n=1 Tax=Kitasatospora sp. NPDC001547 TaxID=3364015 RepID=UPI00367D1D8B|nr:TetR/AcrR family transcriptional regulator [Kitasatospora sp. Xyl93]